MLMVSVVWTIFKVAATTKCPTLLFSESTCQIPEKLTFCDIAELQKSGRSIKCWLSIPGMQASPPSCSLMIQPLTGFKGDYPQIKQ
jgi:hypothetical protein